MSQTQELMKSLAPYTGKFGMMLDGTQSKKFKLVGFDDEQLVCEFLDGKQKKVALTGESMLVEDHLGVNPDMTISFNKEIHVAPDASSLALVRFFTKSESKGLIVPGSHVTPNLLAEVYVPHRRDEKGAEKWCHKFTTVGFPAKVYKDDPSGQSMVRYLELAEYRTVKNEQLTFGVRNVGKSATNLDEAALPSEIRMKLNIARSGAVNIVRNQPKLPFLAVKVTDQISLKEGAQARAFEHEGAQFVPHFCVNNAKVSEYVITSLEERWQVVPRRTLAKWKTGLFLQTPLDTVEAKGYLKPAAAE